jgi:hypothetical protein
VAFGPFERARRIEMTAAALLLRAAHRRDSGVRQRAVRLSPIAFVTLDEPPASSRHAMPPPPSTVPPPPDSSRLPPSSPLPMIGPPPVGQAHPRPGSSPGLLRLPLVSPSAQLSSQFTRDSSGAVERGDSSSFRALATNAASKEPPARLQESSKVPAAAELVAKDLPMKSAFERSAALRASATSAMTLALARIRERAWLGALVLGSLPLLGLGVSWLVTPKGDESAAVPRKLTAHAEPARPVVSVADSPKSASPVAATPAQALEKAAPEPAREAPKVVWSRRAPAPLSAKAALSVSSPSPTKTQARIKASSPVAEERAPRVQIIEERSAKIQVIE